MAPTSEYQQQPVSRSGPIIAATTLIGVGMGGFVDGIILHQILQWHNMVSAKLPPDTLLNAKTNMFWDGMFHAGVWVVTMIGIVLLWNAVKNRSVNLSNKILIGGFLFGWAIFNLVEGVIDHHLLVLHNVREISTSPSSWNFGFLGGSVIMLLIGWMLINKGRKSAFTT
ncbi:DUF2243 domain-containing protein [Adhaeribacter aquaticus]|uniref:DUF2243 domain-containing protein n=1 Tax=Adhaeribacter aquaticus TaxID=299567 RepID=UPI000413924C|nr:DUF2243 domain-containing protein [Adhaeribacter aquaticus]